MAPLIYEDLILIGPAGSEAGVKGWVGAFRLENGAPVWRFNTVPDEGEPGAETWKDPKARLMGGGSVWAPFSLDAEKGVLYVPVSNPGAGLLYGLAAGQQSLHEFAASRSMRARAGCNGFIKSCPPIFHDWDVTQVSPLFETTIQRQAAQAGDDRWQRRHAACVRPRDARASLRSAGDDAQEPGRAAHDRRRLRLSWRAGRRAVGTGQPTIRA